MKFSYNWIKEFLPNLPKPEKVAELFTMHAFEVEDVKRVGSDWVLDIDILPNRMHDAASHIGIAAELCRILKRAAVRLPKVSVIEGKDRISDLVKVQIINKFACPRYSARIVRGVKVGPSPQWLKERLRAVGVGSINNIVDATNYVMLEYGQPLHAFDFDKIVEQRGTVRARLPDGQGTTRKEIIVRFAKKGEKILTLDGEERELLPSVLLIADNKNPLTIAGIKGGAAAGITNKTTHILIESANFDPKIIYRTSRLLGIRSDASNRFEAGRAVEATIPALERVIALIQQVAGGVTARGIADAGEKHSPKRAILLRPDYVSRLLGVELSLFEIKKTLLAIGSTLYPAQRGALRVVPSVERQDLEREEDLIEEIGRLKGFGRIPPKHPHALLLPAHVPDQEKLADIVRDELSRLGFWEQENYVFLGAKLLEVFGLAVHRHVEMFNPVSEDYRFLRSSFLPRLIKNVVDNRGRNDSPKFFEIGKAWTLSQKGAVEREYLGLVSAAKEQPKAGSLRPHVQAPALFELKGVIIELGNAAGIADLVFEVPDVELQEFYPFLQRGKMAVVKSGAIPIGIVGEVREKFYREGTVACAELYLNEWLRLASEEHEYRVLPKYPEALRDISVLVPQEIYSDDVAQEIMQAGRPLVRDVDLFDYYDGEEVGEDQKSLAFHIYYQAPNRTLTDTEVDLIHQKIEQAIVAKNWQVR